MHGPSSLVPHFRMLARYNAGANERLFGACAALPHEELVRSRPAFFGSILGTLNHILVGDRIWLARFEGREVPSIRLDAILFETLPELHRARVAEDERIHHMTDGLSAAFLAGSIAYVNNQGRTLTDPVDALLAHFFNHQTHHRGQVHGMLSGTGTAPPVLDLHRVLNP